MAVEKPKQAASRQEPTPTRVSIFIDSINTIISGSRVTSSSNIPNRLPKSIKIKTVIQTTGPPRSRRLRIMLTTKVFTPPVSSKILKMPLITSKKTLIIIMERASSDANTLTGAVITRPKEMPAISPAS